MNCQLFVLFRCRFAASFVHRFIPFAFAVAPQVDTQVKHHVVYAIVGFIRWRGAWQHRMGTLWEPSDWCVQPLCLLPTVCACVCCGVYIVRGDVSPAVFVKTA